MTNQLAYDTFSREMLDKLQEKIGREKPLIIRKFLKNNSVELDGVVLDSEYCPVSPTFYMQEFYEQYKLGCTIEEIADFASDYYERDYGEEFFEEVQMDSFEGIKDTVVFKVINRERNRKFLKDVPYFSYLDLAIIFCVVIIDPEGRSGSVTIHNHQLEEWGISKSDLYDTAVRNTKKLFGVEIKEIQEVIVDIVLSSDHFVVPPLPDAIYHDLIEEIRNQVVKFPIYVLSNKTRHLGAGCMLYKDIEIFADKLEDDLYIVPSSIHEVLLIPASVKVSDEELLDILHEVNRDELDETEFLSDKIYHFDRKTRHISF